MPMPASPPLASLMGTALHLLCSCPGFFLTSHNQLGPEILESRNQTTSKAAVTAEPEPRAPDPHSHAFSNMVLKFPFLNGNPATRADSYLLNNSVKATRF